MNRYSTRIVLAHWLTVLLALLAFLLGGAAGGARLDGTATLGDYQAHMLAGISVLVIMLLRLYFRWRDGAPPPMGHGLLDQAAKLVHGALYVVVIAIPLSGIATAIGGGVVTALRAGDPGLLPADFAGVAAHGAHKALIGLLLVLAALHILAALKHQFIDRDGLLRRMWFGKPPGS